jgi:hypothetical protein
MKKREDGESIDFFLTRMTKSKSVDRRNLAMHALWQKYEKLIIKMKYKLIHTINDYRMLMRDDLEEYEGRAYETFVHAVDNVDMDRCAHLKDQFSLYINVWGYLMSMNRDMVKHYMDNTNNTTAIHTAVKNDGKSMGNTKQGTSNLDIEVAHSYVDIGDAIEASKKRQVFWSSYDMLQDVLNPTQKRISELRTEGVSVRDISRSLGLKRKEYVAQVDDMKRKFARLITIKSKQVGDETSYSEMLEHFNT